MNGNITDIAGAICAMLFVVGLLSLLFWYVKSDCKKISSENYMLRSMLLEKEIEKELLEAKCRDMANEIYLLSETSNKKTE